LENPLPKALYKRFDTIVQRPLLWMILGPQSFTHQEVIISIAVRCSKIGAAARILTEDDAKLVASKAHRISELLLAMCTEAKTSYTARKSFVEPSQELVFSGAYPDSPLQKTASRFS